MGKRKTINAEMRKGCAGLFAATLCCVGTALPAFAADTDPAPDPVPTVTEKPVKRAGFCSASYTGVS